MAASTFSETLVSYRNTTRCDRLEDFDLYLHRRESLKSWIPNICVKFWYRTWGHGDDGMFL